MFYIKENRYKNEGTDLSTTSSLKEKNETTQLESSTCRVNPYLPNLDDELILVEGIGCTNSSNHLPETRQLNWIAQQAGSHHQHHHHNNNNTHHHHHHQHHNKMVKSLILPLVYANNNNNERKSSTSSSQSSSAYSECSNYSILNSSSSKSFLNHIPHHQHQHHYSSTNNSNLNSPMLPTSPYLPSSVTMNPSLSTSNLGSIGGHPKKDLLKLNLLSSSNHVGYLDKADDSNRIRNQMLTASRRHNSSCHLNTVHQKGPSINLHGCCHHHHQNHHHHHHHNHQYQQQQQQRINQTRQQQNTNNQNYSDLPLQTAQNKQFLTIPSLTTSTNNGLAQTPSSDFPPTTPNLIEMSSTNLCNQCRNATRSLCQSRSASIAHSPSTFMSTAALLQSFQARNNQTNSNQPNTTLKNNPV
jgi:hypothetical protein